MLNATLAYPCACLLALAAGRGLLRLLRVEFPGAGTFFAAPAAMLAVWALALNMGIMAGFGVRDLCLVLYPASLGLAAYGLAPLWRERGGFGAWLILLALALPALVMAPWFVRGLGTFAGSPYPDRWYYLAYGKFLWSYPDSLALARFAPIYDYAANQHLYRFTSGALMAFFSPLSGAPGDPLTASAMYAAFVLFVFSLAGTFFARAAGIVRGAGGSAFCLCLVCVSGWTLNAVLCNNYDNVLALPLFAVLAGLALAADFSRTGQAMLAGLVFAAPAVFYPESLAPLCALAAVILFFRLVRPEPGRERVRPGRAARFCLLAGGVVILCAAPSARILLDRVGAQLSQGLVTGVVRPGEGFFPGLTGGDGFAASAFGLVLPFLPGAGGALALWLGRVWAALLGLGLIALVIRRRWAVLGVLGIFLGGAAIMLFHFRYDYGAYKFLLLGWWAVASCLCAGWELLAGARPRTGRARAAGLFFAAAITATLYCVASLSLRFGEGVYPGSLARYAALAAVRDKTGGHPVGILLDNQADIPFAAYYLDDAPAAPLGRPHEYFSEKTLERTLDPALAANIRRILTDDPDFARKSPDAALLWRSGPFRLYAVDAPPPALTSFTAPGGADLADNRIVSYLGAEPASLTIFAPKDEKALLRLFAFAQPGAGPMSLVLRGPDGALARVSLDRDGPAVFPVSLKAGLSAFTLAAEPLGAAPSAQAAPLPNGATGPVRAGILAPELTPAPQACPKRGPGL